MSYLIWLRNKSLIAIVFFATFSCKQVDEDYQTLVSYFSNTHQFNLDSNTKAVAIISERGGCMSCNKSFSDFISSHIENNSILFVVCSTGIMIDISYFMQNKNRGNVFIDQHDKFGETKLMEKSGVIFLTEVEIDTIVEIDTETKDQIFQYISKRIVSNEH